MPSYNPPLETLTNDELILISFSSTEDWQQEAIIEATKILRSRGYTKELCEERFNQLIEQKEQYWKNEYSLRKTEDYSLIDKFFIILRWPSELFRDWNLGKDGYEKKADNRKILIFLGIVLYLFSYWFFDYLKKPKDIQLSEEQINNLIEKTKQKGQTDSLELEIWQVNQINEKDSSKRFDKPSKSKIINPKFSIYDIMGIWTLDPNGPHADFSLDEKDYYIVDYDGDGSFIYELNEDRLKVFFDNSIEEALIKRADNDTLTLYWASGDFETYTRWKN